MQIDRNNINVTTGKSIAVLPFANMSSDANNEYFSDGITEEIINALTKIQGLKVIARTSSFAFKGKHEDIRKIGNLLGVTSVLEGSVRKAKNRVRITAQLINTDDGTHFWSKNFDRELKDIFSLQDEISLLIANQIRENFGHLYIQDHLVKQSTSSSKAYELFLKARFHQLKWTPESLKRAVEFYDEAIKYDPQFARAYYGNLQCYGLLGAWAFMNTEEAFKKAMDYFRIGQDLDKELPEYTHSIMGQRFWGEWKFQEAFDLNTKTLEINSSYTDAIEAMAELYIATGYFKRAESCIKDALEIDPLSANHHYTLANINYMQKAYDVALVHVEKSLSLNPDLLLAGELKMMCLIWLNQREEFDRFVANREETKLQSLLFNIINGSTKAVSDGLIEEWTRSSEEKSILVPYKLFILANSDRKMQAMKMLETYIDQKRGQIINFRFEPFLESLHGLEEFKNLDVPIFTLPEEKETKTPAQSENISNGSEMEVQFKKLLHYIKTEKPYLNSQLNLNSLSGKVNLHPNKLSFLINEKTGNNFNEFINHYRLEHFKSMALNPKYNHLTLLGMAYESGFNSKTVFNAFFKKTEGVTPSAWKKKAQKE